MPSPPKRLSLLLLLALVAAASAGADEPKPAAKPACTAPEHRQFDFWLGDWEVRDGAGKVVGQNRLTSLHKGCAMQENWTGAGGYTGTSLNIYDAVRKKWYQSWVDSSGGLLLLEGGWADGRMVLIGDSPAGGPTEPARRNRITWTPLPDGRVRQLWEFTTDQGKTWTAAFDGYYAK